MARDPASRANNSSLKASAHEPQRAINAVPDERSGQDERRRGWFWHWNGIVTQYTPLIGLKGIGLLNSYTVWTDRREDSPHRGYAFPSQQSEANFYGEDRAELITINKILVALDLIEIRKEMVRKTDEKGRRWKVPQNLYRVKDRQDGIDLTAADVLRVVELAERDKAVYRYIRKVFSSRFEPIDRHNVWHAILKELASDPTWKKLSGRAAKQEARASARTKAGHRSRQRKQDDDDQKQAETDSETPSSSERKSATNPAPRGITSPEMTTGHVSRASLPVSEHDRTAADDRQTSAGHANRGSTGAAEQSNNGIEPGDEPGNNGSSEIKGGAVGRSNEGCESSVEPGNTMYYQSSSTTTTTTTSPAEDDKQATSMDAASPSVPDQRSISERDQEDSEGLDRQPPAKTQRVVESRNGAPGGRETESGVAGAPGAGPVGDPSPLVLSLYEAANDRSATHLERILLSELEADAGAAAEAAGSTGSEWVAAALREAVGSGSSFVAPKRIREIVNRWATAGAGPRGEQSQPTTTSAPSTIDNVKHVRDGKRDSSQLRDVLEISNADAGQGDRLWGVVLDMLAIGDAAADLFRLRGVVPLGEREDGAFVLGAPTRLAARLLDGKHRDAVEQALSSLLPSQVTISILDPDQWTIVD